MNDTDINGQGVVFNLYHYFWLYDFMTKTQPNVRIPHTIYYLLGEPKFWYFSSRDGKILRKNKVRTIPEEIIKAFTRKIPQCGIFKNNRNFDQLQQEPQQQSNSMDHFIYNYMNEQDFCEFVKEQDFYRHGILQQFVQPKGDNNQVIKSIWSKQVCLFEIFRNNFSINDTKADIFQRVSTFESFRSACEIGPLKGSVLPLTLEQKCNSIAQHVFNVTQEKIKIKSMTLYWKQDPSEEVYLILCSDISTFKSKPIIKLDESDLQSVDSTSLQKHAVPPKLTHKQDYLYHLPSHVDEERLSYPLPTNLKKQVSCFRCKGVFSDKQTFPYRGKLLDLAARRNNDQQKVQLSRDQIYIYESNKNTIESPIRRLPEPSKVSKTLNVCKDCYLEMYLQPNESSTQDEKFQIRQPARMVERNLLGTIKRLELTKTQDTDDSFNLPSISTTRAERSIYFQEFTQEAKRLNRILSSMRLPSKTSSLEKTKKDRIRQKSKQSIMEELYGLKKKSDI